MCASIKSVVAKASRVSSSFNGPRTVGGAVRDMDFSLGRKFQDCHGAPVNGLAGNALCELPCQMRLARARDANGQLQTLGRVAGRTQIADLLVEFRQLVAPSREVQRRLPLARHFQGLVHAAHTTPPKLRR